MALRCSYPTERRARGWLSLLGLASAPLTQGLLLAAVTLPNIGDDICAYGWPIVTLSVGSVG